MKLNYLHENIRSLVEECMTEDMGLDYEMFVEKIIDETMFAIILGHSPKSGKLDINTVKTHLMQHFGLEE